MFADIIRKMQSGQTALSKMPPNMPAKLDNAMRPVAYVFSRCCNCVCVAPMAENVHLGLRQEKAAVPDSTPRRERKTFLNAQAT